MAIQMTCPSCGREYNLADTMEGKKVRCKDCEETFTVGDSGRAGVVSADTRRQRASAPRDRDDEEDDRPRGRRRDRDEDEETRPARRRERRDEEDDRPRPRRRKQSGSGGGLVLALSLGGGLLVVGVVVVLLFTFLGGKFTPEKFAQVKAGMSEKEVTDLLGRPSESFDPDALGFNLGGVKFNVKSLIWKHNNKAYLVEMLNGKVAGTASFGMNGKDFAFNMGDFQSNFDPKNPGINPFEQNFPKIPNNPPADPNFPLVPNNPPADQNFPKVPTNPPADPKFPNIPNFPANPMNPQAGSKPEWNRIQVGMTEQEVQTICGKPVFTEDVQPSQVGLFGLTAQEITRPNGQTKPVRKLTYVDPGKAFLDVILVDGRVSKIKK